MQSWEYELDDVLRIRYKGQEIDAKIVGYADSIDDTKPLIGVLRTPTGRWKKASAWNYIDIERAMIIEQEQRCKQCHRNDLPLNQQTGLCVRCLVDNEQAAKMRKGATGNDGVS